MVTPNTVRFQLHLILAYKVCLCEEQVPSFLDTRILYLLGSLDWLGYD